MGRFGVGSVVRLSPELFETFAPSDELVADWKPTDYLTYHCMIPSANDTRIRHQLTIQLSPTDNNGTRASVRFGTPSAGNPRYSWLVRLGWHLIFKRVAKHNMNNWAKVLKAMIEEDIKSGKIPLEDLKTAYQPVVDEHSASSQLPALN